MPGIDERDGELGRRLVARMPRLTMDRNAEAILANVRRNSELKDRGRSLAALRGAGLGAGDRAIVIAAGPSIKRLDPAKDLREAGFRGATIATDSAIAYCLRSGIVPDLVVSLDPHPTRIVRWLGDPALTAEHLSTDSYFRRQDMDTRFADELGANLEILALLDRHGPDMRIALCTSASEAVVSRVMETGMEIYWWNPMLDDPDEPGSLTIKIFEANGLPCLNAGGNVGTACWMMAQAVIGKKVVGVTGMDFSYFEGTPYEHTQYYHEIVDLVGEENLQSVFMRVHNPHTNTWFYTDPAYMWYREAFLELSADAGCRTVNCTGSGILFGGNVEFLPLADFLAEVSLGDQPVCPDQHEASAAWPRFS